MFKTVHHLFVSTGFTLALFGLLVGLLVPLTVFAELKPLLLLPVKIVLFLICTGLIVCTLSRFKRLRRSTLVVHIGSFIILVGGLVSTFGFVATVNIYERDTIDTVFNWDVKKDVPLGYELRVAGINMDLYPVGVRIGVLKNGRKADLIETRTGTAFNFGSYRIEVLRLDPFAKVVYLAIQSPAGELIGTLATDGRRDLPPGFPLDFKLVAYQDPHVKRMWVDLELRENGELVAAGTSEVNHPLRWQGMKFFLTQVAADPAGRPYAGIQISRDPGVPYVYVGFIVLCLGLLLMLYRWGRGEGRKRGGDSPPSNTGT